MRSRARALLARLRAHLGRPVVFTRGTLLGTGTAIGTILAGALFLAALALSGLDKETDARLDDARRERNRIEAIVERLVNLEQPTTAELERRIVRALVVCSETPSCRRRFALLIRRTGVLPPPATPVPRDQSRPAAPAPGAGGDGFGPGPGAPPMAPPVRPHPRPAPGGPPATPPAQPPAGPEPGLVVDPPPIDLDGPGGLPPFDIPPLELLPPR